MGRGEACGFGWGQAYLLYKPSLLHSRMRESKETLLGSCNLHCEHAHLLDRQAGTESGKHQHNVKPPELYTANLDVVR